MALKKHELTISPAAIEDIQDGLITTKRSIIN
jgi:hypothetical protein